jgi:hypothetical protein
VRDEPRGGQQGVEVTGGVACLLEMIHQLPHETSENKRKKWRERAIKKR